MNSRITREDLLYVKDLAKIDLTEDELVRYAANLDAIVLYAAMLQEVDITGVEPMYSPILDQSTPLRDDIAKPGLTQEQALSQSDFSEAGHFRVPKTIEG